MSLLYSCANIGRPEGGMRDEFPPIFVKGSPEPGSVNVRPEKLVLNFDEVVQLKDQMKKVTVSPVQKEMPVVKADGRSVTVEFRDTLQDSTTYSIDFSDAIRDNNEGNPLTDCSVLFSTGPDLDTMQVSGMMLRARDLEPMQYILVGMHKNMSDTAFTKLPFAYLARTNEAGQFTFRGVKSGQYKVYGLNDLDGDYKFARSEDLAFNDSVITTTTESYQSTDTVFTYSHEVDTVIARAHTKYLPNDVLLMMFNEDYMPLYLKKYERSADNKMHVLFSTVSTELPKLKVLKPEKHAKDWYRLERTEKCDSMFYWLTDSAMIMSDSIMVEMTYLYTDSLEQLTHRSDTIHFNLKQSQIKRREQEKKAKAEKLARMAKEDAKEFEQQQKNRQNAIKRREKEKAEAEKAAKMGVEGAFEGLDVNPLDTAAVAPRKKSIFDSIPELTIDCPATSVNKYETLKLKVPVPLDSIVPGSLRLSQMVDSVWIPIDTARLEPVKEYDILQFEIRQTWEYGAQYKLEIDSCGMRSVYGHLNKTFKREFKVPAEEDYSNLYLKVNVQDSAFVELLNNSDQMQRIAVVEGGMASFEDVKPGTYYARLIIDRNGNGIWDPGNYGKGLQPEEVYYFPKKLQLKRNWDVEQDWNIYEIPIDKQKPLELRKNKTEAEKKVRNNQQGEDEEEDEFGSNQFMNNMNNANGRNNNNRYQNQNLRNNMQSRY